MDDPVRTQRGPEPAGLALTRSFEVFSPRVYDDARPTHVLSKGDRPLGTLAIGYGYTGEDVKIGMPEWTEAHARSILELHLQDAYNTVDQMLPGRLLPHRRAALGDFVFNAGPEAFERSTLARVLQDGDFEQVVPQMQRWVFAQGKVNAGLQHRRKLEINLWNGIEPAINLRSDYTPSVKPDWVMDVLSPRQSLRANHVCGF